MWIRRINYGSCLKRGSDPVEHTVHGTNKINFIIKIVIQTRTVFQATIVRPTQIIFRTLYYLSLS